MMRVEVPVVPSVSYTYYVEATDGDHVSSPSETITLPAGGSGMEETGIVKADFSIDGRTVSAPSPVEIVDLTGRRLFLGTGRYILPSAGIYIVRQGNTATKLIVK